MSATATAETYRRYQCKVVDGVTQIIELEPTTKHPINWIDGAESAESARHFAAARGLPVVQTLLDGTVKQIEDTFDRDAFERACYGGYVSYGYSMSDGYYAPLVFDSFAYGLRRDPDRNTQNGCDVSAEVLEFGLPLYKESLKTWNYQRVYVAEQGGGSALADGG